MKEGMRDLTDLFKALADESRLRALYALKGGELCVCQLIALLDLAPSTVSKHLSILRAARLVDSRKEGRWMYYRLSREFRTPSAARILELLFKDMAHTTQIADDRKRMKKISDEGVEALCRRLFCKT
jgi:ArsR family transcriptional regulator, arsenate/arsenite/antimonite-responsive transcriptional repressor